MKHTTAACIPAAQTLRFWLFSLLSIIASLILLTSTGFSQSATVDVVPDETVNGSVELTPGYISGTVHLGGQNISRIDLTAESTDYSARIYPTAEGPYSMTVNVPAGTGLDYTVKGMAWMDGYTTRMYFRDRAAVVHEGQSSQVDFIINSGYVSVEIVTNSCSLVKSEVTAFLNNGNAFSRADTRRGSENMYRFPVQPNSGIDVYGQAQLSTGKTVSLTGRIVDVTPGADTQVTWVLNCGPGQLSAIQHDVNYHMPMDYHYSYLYDEGASSPSRTARHTGSHVFDNIAPSNWRIYTYSYWNNGQNFIGKDLRDIYAPAGEIVLAPVDEYPGFLQGRITLTGTRTIQDTHSAYMYAYGKNSLYPSYRTNSRALIDNIDGAFNLALPHGEWSSYVSYYRFYDIAPDDEYLNAYLYRYDYSQYYNTLFINGNETITGHDLTLETGSATIKYSRSDGGAFSAPYLYARSYIYDESGRLSSYYYSQSRGDAAADTVTFVGFPGTYEVDAWATVDGSQTTFGKVTVEIVAGVEKVVDIGGPALTVATPEPNLIVEENRVVVSGTATDDMGVASVTVNGAEAALASTSNPDDLNEVSFSIEIELLEGENIIKTIAADTSANESTDTRKVTYEVPQTPAAPEEIETAPEESDTVPEDSGTAPESSDAVTASIDIKPGSCKNPLNVKSRGVLPVAILGSSSFEASKIDPSSVRLMDIPALRSSVEDAADGNCATEGPDGYMDLNVKFDTQEIVSTLDGVIDNDVVTMTLTGTLLDGTEFSGDDIVTILVRGKKK